MRKPLLVVVSACYSFLFLVHGAFGAIFLPTPDELDDFLSNKGNVTSFTSGLDLTQLPRQTYGEKSYVVVDDMLFDDSTIRPNGAVSGNLWPSGNVYYVFDPAVSNSNRAAWTDAAAAWSAVANVKFFEGTGDGNYIHVENSDENSSWVGMIGGSQYMHIVSWASKYIIAHEIGHALGLIHEQSRSDRDSYVIIFSQNIQAGQQHNFDIWPFAMTIYGAYDFDSLMHYARRDFSQNGQNTIEPTSSYSSYLNTMGQRDYLSQLDQNAMAQRYGSPGGGGTQELLTNGDFEAHYSGWTINGNADILAGSYPRGGSYYGYLGNANNGFGNLFTADSVSIPANATTVTLSFWLNVTSQETENVAYDKMNVSVLPASGGSATLATYSNLNRESGPGNPYYSQRSFDLRAYKGQSLKVYFDATTDPNLITTFRIDDVSLKVTLPTPSPSPTPTSTPFKAVNPNPPSNATGQPINLTLSWSNGGGATSYKVYFGTDSTPDSGEYEGERNNTTFTTPTLNYSTKYYWRIDATNSSGSTTGDVWNFTTGSAPTPTATPNQTPTVTPNPTATATPGGTPTPSPNCAPGWSAGAAFPAAAIIRATGNYFPANGRFYVVGGRSADTAGSDFSHPFEYDPGTNTWITKAAILPDNQVNNMACGVLTVGGTPQIYCVGGSAAGVANATARVFSYNPVSDVITALPVADNWPGNTTGTILPGGFAVVANKLFIIGGFQLSTNMTAQTWQFDPAAAIGSRWVRRANYPVARGYIPATTIGGLIYTAGGSTTDGTTFSDTTDSFRYDPVSDAWTAIANIPRATGETRAIAFNNQMWVLGGGRTTPNPSSEVDIYNPGNNNWITGLPFTAARRNFPADSDGALRVWIAGGYNASEPVLNTTEAYRSCGSVQVGNISTRLRVGTGDNALFEGFIVQGPAGSTKKIMVRGLGPFLAGFGVPDTVANPTLDIFEGNTKVATNNDWGTTQTGGLITGDQSAEIAASGLAPSNGLESAIIANLAPGAYTAIVRGLGNTAGIGLVDAFDLSAASQAKVVNFATRGLVQPGDKLLTAGFIIQNGAVRAVIRAIGPSLTAFGINSALPDTTLQLRDQNGNLVQENDDWETDQKQELMDTGLQPSNAKEAAIVRMIPPGQYTAQVRGKPEATGIGVVEVYFLQ